MSKLGKIERWFPADYEVEFLETIDHETDEVCFAPLEVVPEWPALFTRPRAAPTIALRFTISEVRRWIGVFSAEYTLDCVLVSMPAARQACVRVNSWASIIDVELAKIVDERPVCAIVPLVELRLLLLLGFGDATAYDEHGLLWVTDRFVTDGITPVGLLDGRFVVRGEPELDGDGEFAIDLATGFVHGPEHAFRPVFDRRWK